MPTTDLHPLWQPARAGDLRLPHRLAMAPMRAGWRKVTDAVHAAGGDDTHELYPALVRALAPLDLAYLHLVHGGDE
ncbi:hypothetical protein ACPYPG_03275 [Streptomyces sp. FR-108]|uniref:hypothetical protein n=1 Tax=Streptomyces sp. FR-108 TaxID=3416665 RepID=UPI003CEF75AD